MYTNHRFIREAFRCLYAGSHGLYKGSLAFFRVYRAPCRSEEDNPGEQGKAGGPSRLAGKVLSRVPVKIQPFR